jgi:hypothetical protein
MEHSCDSSSENSLVWKALPLLWDFSPLTDKASLNLQAAQIHSIILPEDKFIYSSTRK